MADSSVRKQVHYSGRVQGVGFRQTVCAVAGRHVVTGYVLNLADGRVKLVIEGDQRRVEEFLSDVDTQMERYIQGSQIDVLTATGEFSQFNIVF